MFRFLLFPIAGVWSLFMLCRRRFYAIGKRKDSQISSICVGNLCMGGSGKTPHVEYLLNLLKDNYKTAALSRGYGRKTKGFLFATPNSTSEAIGDEPLQLYKKHAETTVAVCEDRVEGLRRILEEVPDTDVVILDDAYQYLQMKYSLSIILTDYYLIYPQDYVFPVGKLRESALAAKEADIIVVTKSPNVMPELDRQLFLEKLKPLPHQKVYFSYMEYGQLQPLTKAAQAIDLQSIRSVVSVSGIANPYSFLKHIDNQYRETQHLTFADHHVFKNKDIEKVIDAYNRAIMRSQAVITTEKDAMRLMTSDLWQMIAHLPVFTLPIVVKFHEKQRKELENQVKRVLKIKKI